MGLSGNLKTMALPDILQWIATGQKTGTLHLEKRSIRKRIIVRDGLIFSSWSNDPRESLGQFLIRERLISEEQLFRALQVQEQQGRLIGSIFVADGLLTEEDLRRALKAKTEETIYDLFLWPEGQFEFRDGEFPHEVLIHFDTPVTPVILEGIRRVDEWERIREVLPHLDITLKVQGAPHDIEDPVERQFLGLAAAAKTLAEISLQMRRSEFETAGLAFALYRRGVVALDQVRKPTESADPIGAIQGLLTLAYQRLQERRYNAAVKAYEEVLSLDRLNQNAKTGLLAAQTAWEQERVLKAIPLSKVPFLTMDMVTLTRQDFDPQEGFVLSRVNGEWNVQAILKLCPMDEKDTLLIFSRLIERNVIELRDV